VAPLWGSLGLWLQGDTAEIYLMPLCPIDFPEVLSLCFPAVHSFVDPQWIDHPILSRPLSRWLPRLHLCLPYVDLCVLQIRLPYLPRCIGAFGKHYEGLGRLGFMHRCMILSPAIVRTPTFGKWKPVVAGTENSEVTQ
jgi:hypothetical protein